MARSAAMAPSNRVQPRKLRSAIWVAGLVGIASATYLLNHHDFDDTVPFSGDRWDYQSLAVNLVHGHGYQHGAAEGWDTYRFIVPPGAGARLYHPIDGLPEPAEQYFRSGPRYSFYRTPGYPAFLATVYALTGVRPSIAKVVQALLLAACAAAFPLVSWWYWGTAGLLTGTLASVGFTVHSSPSPDEILSEPLFVFMLFFWAIHLIVWDQRPNVLRTVGFGVTTTALLFVKGTAIFMPAAFLLYVFWKRIPHQRPFRLVCIYIATLISLTSLWGVYGYLKTGDVFLLSTQSRTLLLDSHNENTLDDGGWHPEWREQDRLDPRYLYNQAGVRDRPTAVKLARFWIQHWSELPRSFAEKLKQGYRRKDVLLTIAGTLMFYASVWTSAWRSHAAKSEGGIGPRVPVFPIILLTTSILTTLIFYGNSRFVGPFLSICLATGMHGPFVLFVRIRRAARFAWADGRPEGP